MASVPDRAQRRMAAILAADVVGYSKLMEEDEESTHRRIKTLEREVIGPAVGHHQGRVVKTTGDGFLIDFPSPVEAVRCALTVQKALTDNPLQLRIGINLGDVIIEQDGDLYGDGVNVAARLEALCDPGGVLVSGKVYDEVDGKVEAAFESRGEQSVKNIAKPVRVYAVASATAQPTTAPEPLPLPDKPSIAVLPFTNMSGDPEQEYFADGVVEDVITALSRVRWFFVVARNSSFTYKGRAVDIRQVGRELGVRYVLEGSIRKAGNRVRITGQLSEAATGRHIWADKFDGDLGDIFDLQDQITEAVVGAIEPSLRAAEVERARSKPTENLDAYDLYLRALPHFYRMTKAGLSEAVALCDKAIALDPSFTLAKALAGSGRAIRLSLEGGEVGDHELSLRLAREVVQAGTTDAEALHHAAHVLGYIAKAHEEALGAISRSLELNPNSAHAHRSAGWVQLYVDEPALAEEHFRRALRLSPLDPEKGIATTGLAVSFAMRGQYQEALEYARRAVREMPQYPSAHKTLIHMLVINGLEDEARAAATRFLEMSPTFTLTHQRTITPYRNQQFCAEYHDALKRAGIPE